MGFREKKVKVIKELCIEVFSMAFYILEQKRIVNICDDLNKIETTLLPILCVCEANRLPLTLHLVHVQIINNDDISIIILLQSYWVWIQEKRVKKEKHLFFCRLEMAISTTVKTIGTCYMIAILSYTLFLIRPKFPQKVNGGTCMYIICWDTKYKRTSRKGSSLGRYVFGSEISYNKAPPRLPGLGC